MNKNRGKRIRFYATKEDIVGIMQVVEQEIPVEYVRMGWYETDDVKCIERYPSVCDIPHIGYGENVYYMGNRIYMIYPKSTELQFREVEMYKSHQLRYMLDTEVNPEAVFYYTGGISLTSPDVMCFAEINTLGGGPFCDHLFKRIKKEFRRISKCYNDMYFCPGAIDFQRKGGRLVYDAATRIENDIPLLDTINDFSLR